MIPVSEVESHLLARGYRVVHETDRKRAYQFGTALPLYLSRKSKSGITVLVAHPDLDIESIRSRFEGVEIGTGYYHSSHMRLFPKRRNGGKSDIHYGWGLSFSTESALTRFLDEIIGPVGVVSRHAPHSASALGGAEIPSDVGTSVPDQITDGQDGLGMATFRIGQIDFKQRLVAYWKTCAVTGLAVLPLLRASHIIPWSKSSASEKTNVFNGLLLAPHIDAAFDAGYITFSETGVLLLSPRFNEVDAVTLGVHRGQRLRQVDVRHLPFLAYHRREIFQA